MLRDQQGNCLCVFISIFNYTGWSLTPLKTLEWSIIHWFYQKYENFLKQELPPCPACWYSTASAHRRVLAHHYCHPLALDPPLPDRLKTWEKKCGALVPFNGNNLNSSYFSSKHQVM